MNYKKCEYCGANLDYGEVCDCTEEIKVPEWHNWLMKRFMGRESN